MYLPVFAWRGGAETVARPGKMVGEVWGMVDSPMQGFEFDGDDSQAAGLGCG